MFVLKQGDSYEWTVSVQFPVSGDKHKTDTFKAEFKRLPQSRIKEIYQSIQDDKMGDKDLVKEILVGWKEVTDDKGNDIPFSEASLEKLLDIQLVAASISKAFLESITGSKIKNF